MVCGPAPVVAIKEGDLAFGKDTAFVFAEVNADKVTWQIDLEKDEKTVKSLQSDYVGDAMITKRVGEDSGEDLKSNYKYSGEKGKKKPETKTILEGDCSRSQGSQNQ